MELNFADGCDIATDDHGEIESVLQRIEWPHPVQAVVVTRRLAGGRSGSLVLDAEVQKTGASAATRHVIKLGPADDAKRESEAYEKHIDKDSVLCTKIIAFGTGGLPGDREAVVYQHAAEFAALPAESVSTLEEMVTAAVDGELGALDRAVITIETLLKKAKHTLYRDRGPDKKQRTKLTWLNRTLGVDLVVEVDRGTAPDVLRYGAPLPEQLREQRVFARDVLAASCRPDHPIGPGTLFRLAIDNMSFVDGRLIGTAGEVTVEVVCAEPHQSLCLSDFSGRVDLQARVVTTRARQHRERIDRVIESDGGDPWATLTGLLTEPMEGWVASVVHGDLNARNIVVVDGQPYLIDYANADADRPMLGDIAWLEVCLNRDVLSRSLDWSDLVRLQRVLMIAMRVGVAIDELLDGESDEFKAAFGVLWAVRRGARDAYLADGRTSWWREYRAQLTLASHRSLKWDGQDDGSVRASAATAYVAAEPPDEVFHNRTINLRQLMQHVLHQLDPEAPETVALLADLPDLGRQFGERHFDAARERVVRAWFGARAAGLVEQLNTDHEVYIRLKAFINLQGDLSDSESQDDAIALVATQPQVVVLGEAGSGKSTVVRELQYLLAKAVMGQSTTPPLRTRMPVVLRASEVVRTLDPAETLAPLQHVGLDDVHSWLRIGALHVFVDAVNELSIEDRELVANWLKQLSAKYGRTPVAVCHRSFDFDPELLGFPTVRLQEVSVDDARAYVRKWLAERGRSEHADSLVDVLFEDPEHETLRDLACKPLFLWMIVEWYVITERIPGTVGELFDEFIGWYLEERHHRDRGEQPPLRYRLEEKLPFLEAIASHLVEQGNVTEISRAATQKVVEPFRSDWKDVLDEILSSEMLQEDGGEIRFLHQLFQEYFAAKVLLGKAEEDKEWLHRRVLSFAWREPTRIMLGSPHTPPDLASFMLQAAVDVNPEYAARLLRDVENPPPAMLGRFVDAQGQALRSASTGETGWLSAAKALGAVRDASAEDELLAVLLDNSPVAAKLAALTALAPASRRPDTVGEGFVHAMATVLVAGDQPAEVRNRAAMVVGRLRLHRLTGVLWDLASDKAPWEVAVSAYLSLRRLKTVLTDELRKRMEPVLLFALRSIEDELCRVVQLDKIGSLNSRRSMIVRELAHYGHLDLVLERRFAYNLWNDRISVDPIRAARAALAPGDAGNLLLAEEVETDRLLHHFATGDDRVVAASAHVLLGRGAAEALLDHTNGDAGGPQLLAAAAALHQLGDGALPYADTLIRDVVANYRPELLEALCALLSAVPHEDTGLSYRLRAIAQRRVDDEFRQTDEWQWIRAETSVGFPLSDEVAGLLAIGAEGVWTAFRTVYSLEHTYDGSPGLYVQKWPTEIVDAVRAQRPENPDDDQAPIYALGVCGLGVTEEVDFVFEVATNEVHLCALEETGSASYGYVSQSRIAGVLSALGHLRNAEDDGVTVRVAEFLRAFDPSPWHPSVARGRLVGLGVLGDWRSVFEALPEGDPFVREVALNVLQEWVPGPCSPPGGLDAAVAWLVDALGGELQPQVRSTLEEVRSNVEMKLGHYVEVPKR